MASNSKPQGRVLILAGSDSGGGAGIQADIKTVTALGGYAMTAVTAITVQNTNGVFNVHPVPLSVVREQARVVLEDIGADVLKTGMLGSADMVDTVASISSAYAAKTPLIVDPVMIAKGGHALLQEDAVEAMRAKLIPRATLVTPNAPEAAALTGMNVNDVDGQRAAGRAIIDMGAKAVLVKGGHVPGDVIHDVLVLHDRVIVLQGPRIDTRSTHGTGCTLASAIATGMAQGLDLATAVSRARDYVVEAIRRAPGLGQGHGPLDHGWPLRGAHPN